ncbi:MAG: hypothetical protein M1819_001046 [Sarea resinae]|nr:MAG: hypothetical protein M1819_001046 [Sarea resinae]
MAGEDTSQDSHPKVGPGLGFLHPPTAFRSTISRLPGAIFPPAKGRYVLYIARGCPWASRANIVRSLKGLESAIQLVVVDPRLKQPEGWKFTGENGTDPIDPIYGFTHLKDLYHKADPDYKARYSVPVLWDKQCETIVNNESSEIIRMLYGEFDDFLPEEKREVNQPGGGLYPEHLRGKIDEMNAWVYDTINSGVYKAGFASTQAEYEAALYALFESFDRLEEHLADTQHEGPYLLGANITEADVRLFTSMVRFDAAYYTLFKCNLRMIRHDYPHLHRWLRTLYWDESARTNGGAFKKTTNFKDVSPLFLST